MVGSAAVYYAERSVKGIVLEFWRSEVFKVCPFVHKACNMKTGKTWRCWPSGSLVFLERILLLKTEAKSWRRRRLGPGCILSSDYYSLNGGRQKILKWKVHSTWARSAQPLEANNEEAQWCGASENENLSAALNFVIQSFPSGWWWRRWRDILHICCVAYNVPHFKNSSFTGEDVPKTILLGMNQNEPFLQTVHWGNEMARMRWSASIKKTAWELIGAPGKKYNRLDSSYGHK